MYAIDVHDLRKTYGGVDAVRRVDLTVAEGEVFALLGPNGAGKTTTVEILEGFRTATSGSVSVLGLDPASAGRQLRQQVGVVLQQVAVEPFLTVREVLERNAGYYPNPLGVGELIERVGLAEKADARIKTLSGGQQRRLDVALGIVGRPRLLFLDEPTTGFDPNARRGAWDLVRSLREVGTTIVLTTHYMDEAQALADRLAVMARGTVVATGTVEDIGGRDTAASRIRFGLPPAIDPARLPVRTVPDERGRLRVDSRDPTRTLHDLTSWALGHDIALDQLTVDKPSLEEIYLELVRAEERVVPEPAATTRGRVRDAVR